ncbi:valine--tRNA ligase [Candidatus Saccharibacteria bacterium]|nr:valine--tRNA ligase [Candidatus Saccharibacteria bacterium]
MLNKVYKAQDYEQKIYRQWDQSGAFKPSNNSGRPFSIPMPPPNATGVLHIGHCMMLAIQDSLVRFNRMKGRPTLWIPGTDHAGLATNAVIEKQLLEEGTNKYQIGREAFVSRTKTFVENSRDTIKEQVKLMGASCDWSRERYTFEPGMNQLVSRMFVKMYQDGLIYRGHRIVNWDPNLMTNVSDDEVEYKLEKTNLYYLKFGPFTISTARPETKFGDKYVVVHPDDPRYQGFQHRQELEVDWVGGKITATVIKDDAIDMDFGTGAMTITPWHDALDFEIANRHDLDKEQIIDFDGKMLGVAGDCRGMTILEAREKVVEILDSKGLLVKIDPDYQHNIAINSRNKGVIEPQIRLQWFIDVNRKAVDWKGQKLSLKQVMQEVVRDHSIEIIPGYFDKTYFAWIDNLKDWCISRQIWWGHQIPVWYRDQEVYVGLLPPEHDGQGQWEQDPDTLDTWFSSGLWSWSTLIDDKLAQDPKLSLEQLLDRSQDYQRFHPVSLLETGYDIIFFWVARMILMTTYATGQVPFKKVYLHGLVRTKSGKKMSKSDPATIIDPLEIVPEYGADALRLAMLVGMSPGSDSKIYLEKIAKHRNFCNKLWNVARYVESSQIDLDQKLVISSSHDHYIVERLNQLIKEVDAGFESHNLSIVGQSLESFLWDDFADWYIEASKVEPNPVLARAILLEYLKLLHPLAPFITEAIWQELEGQGLLISANWPDIWTNHLATKAIDFNQVKAIVEEVRSINAELDDSGLVIDFENSDWVDYRELIKFLTRSSDKRPDNPVILKSVSSNLGLLLELSQAKYLDQKLKAKLSRELQAEQNLESRLKNKSYIDKAPEEKVAETRQDLARVQQNINKLKAQIDQLSDL